MKENMVLDYYTFNELDTLIGIQLRDFIEELVEHTTYTGLLYDNDGGLFYADGIFEIMETEWPTQSFSNEEIKLGAHLVEQDREVECRLISVVGTKGSNNNDLIGSTYKVKSYHSVNEVLFSFEEFKNIINKLGIPLIADRSELHKKKFNYDAQIVNQKTLFTLYEACSIASNVKLSSIPRPMFDCELFDHNLSVMSECVKGQNQKGFHLITKELWISTTDDCYEPCSRKYNNGTTLNVDVVLDQILTVISKNELIRWCEFMEIETGLTKDDDVENESVEFLKLEIERLRNTPPQQMCPQPPPLQDTSEVEKLKNELSIKEKEIDTLKENTFIEMTKTLKVMRDAQAKFWKDYNPDNIPKQKNVNFFISEKLGLSQTGDNRKAAELATAIKPIE